MAGEGIDKFDLERAERLGEWRGSINGELKSMDSQLKMIREDQARYADDMKRAIEAMEQRDVKTNKRIDKIDLKAAKIAGAVSILLLLGVPLLRSWLGI